MSQIDRPADDNTWHDVPDFSRENLKNQAKSTFNQQKPISKNDVKGAAGDATQAASGSRDPMDAADLAARDQQYGTDSVDANQGARAGVSNLRDQASANVPDETKDRAREYRDRTKNYMSQKLPQERRDQAIFRLKKMIIEVQGHPDCAYQNTPVDTNKLMSFKIFKRLRPFLVSLKNMPDTAEMSLNKVPEP